MVRQVVRQVIHETITRKPLCFISLHIIISIIALDQNCFMKASSAQPPDKGLLDFRLTICVDSYQDYI